MATGSNVTSRNNDLFAILRLLYFLLFFTNFAGNVLGSFFGKLSSESF